MDIEDILTEQDTPHYTEQRPMLWGSFNLSHTSIPFYQAVLPLEEAAKELKLVENLPADIRSKWKLEELFQREIDWERVKDDIVDGYLRRPEKQIFFNSLTVALLPLDDKGMLASSYGDTSRPPDIREALKKDPWRINNVGGVQLITNERSPNGYIRWDPKRIFPATIDGQHRLAALQTYVLEGNLTSSAMHTTLSVIFLVLDPRVGFDIAKMQLAEDENPILTVIREVFIDLNKHAKEVERARQILLDDQQIESRCLRRLLASRMGEQAEGRLPLGIVHWQHNVTAKFNVNEQTGPFITTVELLYYIVDDLLDLRRPKDPLDKGDVLKFVQSIENALRVSRIIAEKPNKFQGVKPLDSYVETMHLKLGFEVPFVNLTAPYLRACDDGFDQLWRPLIVGVLTRFKPYKNFIEEVRKRGGIDGELGFFLVLPRKAQERQLKAWGESRMEKIDKPLKELAEMKTKDWPYYAVFQKGLLRASGLAWKHFPVLAAADNPTMENFLNRWVAFLDELWDRGVLAVKADIPDMPRGEKARVWVGVCLNVASETVRWSESDVQRIAALLTLWWYFYASALDKPGSFLKRISGARANEKFPVAGGLADDLRRGLRSVITYADEALDDEEEIKKRVEKRLKNLIVLARNMSATPSSEGAEEGEGDEGNGEESRAPTDDSATNP